MVQSLISPKTKDLTLDDLDSVVELHKHCFLGATSIFSLLDHEIVKLFYAQLIEEPESYAAVLVEPDSNRVVGLAYGTLQPGIQGRFLRRHFFRVLWSLFKKLFVSITAWRFLGNRLCSKKSSNVPLRKYDFLLEKAGIPVPKGIEALFLVIAVHKDFRGGGNAVRLVKYYVHRTFQKGVVRVRGGVLLSNPASVGLFKKLGWNIKNVSGEKVSVWIDKPAEDA